MFENIAFPTPGFSDAPITAIELGLKNIFFGTDDDIINTVSLNHGYIYSSYYLVLSSYYIMIHYFPYIQYNLKVKIVDMEL